MVPKKRILFTFPTSWDRKQLESCRSRWEDRFEIVFGEPTDEDAPWDFDVVGYIDDLAERLRGKIDGVASSSDYPGATVAGAIAARLGLPGTPPDRIIRASHKYASRLAQRSSVPEATPAFDLIDPRDPATGPKTVGFPCFLKPVKGAFSIMSGKILDAAALRAFLDHPATRDFLENYVAMFNRLVRALTDLEVDGRYFVAEEFLHGRQVTVEGFEHGGSVEILGVVDSIFHGGTASFARFDYPSTLLAEVQEKMAEIAKRLVADLGLRSTLFNIEMIVDPVTDRIAIIEVNPRMCGQFADLYEKVDGTNAYEVALALAAGEAPVVRRREGTYALATSFPLRVFEPVRVASAPCSRTLQAAEGLHPGTLVWSECEAGWRLADFLDGEDGHSARYGIVNVGAGSRAELLSRLAAVRERLGHAFEPLEQGDVG